MELLELLKILGKYRAMILVLVVSSLVFTVAMTYVVEERYESSALVLVRPQAKLKFAGAQGDKETLDFPIPRVVPFEAMTKTVAEVMRSRAVTEEVVRRLGLDKPSMETVWWKIWKRKIKNFLSDVSTYLKYGRLEEVDPFDEATQLVQNLLSVEPTKDTYVFEITFLAKFPELAAAVVDTAADVFAEYNLDMSRKESTIARESIEEQAKGSEAAVATARERMRAYKEEYGIVELDKEVETKVDTIAQLKIDLEKVERSIAGASAKVAALERQLAGDGERGSRARQRLLAGSLRDDVTYELVVARSDLDSRRAEQARLSAALDEYAAELEQLPAQQLELDRLRLDLAVAEDTYRFIRKALDEARIREAEETREIRVIAPGTVPDYPVRPIKVYYAGVAFALALLLGLVIALLLEYLNFTIETPEGAQEALELPLLATFPRLDA